MLQHPKDFTAARLLPSGTVIGNGEEGLLMSGAITYFLVINRNKILSGKRRVQPNS
mgnify:CR=1 FL=1